MKTYARNINLWVWWLTGLHQGFDDSELDLPSAPGRPGTSEGLVEARRVLGLDRAETYYLRPLVAAMTSVPERMAAIPRSVEMLLYRKHLYADRPVVTGGQIVAAQAVRSADVVTAVTALPAPKTWELRALDSLAVQLTNDAGGAWVCRYKVVEDRLIIAFPPELGWDFHILPDGEWVTGSVVTMVIPPRNYPYRQVLTEAGANDKVIDLLARQNCLEAFLNLTTDVRRLGTLAWAVALEALTLDTPVAEIAEDATVINDYIAGIIRVDGSDILVDGSPLILFEP